MIPTKLITYCNVQASDFCLDMKFQISQQWCSDAIGLAVSLLQHQIDSGTLVCCICSYLYCYCCSCYIFLKCWSIMHIIYFC